MFGYLGNIFMTTGMLFGSLYICAKSIDISTSAKQKIFFFFFCLVLTILNLLTLQWLPSLLVDLISWIVLCVFVLKFFKLNLDTAISAYLMAYGLSYSLFFTARLSIGLIFAPFVSARYAPGDLINFYDPIYLLIYSLIALLQLLLAYLLFRIRRFKNGFPFLFEKYAVILALIVAGSILTMSSGMTFLQENYTGNYIMFFSLVIGIIAVGAGIFIWIRRGMKVFYKRKMKERGMALFQHELTEKEDEIQRLKAQNNILRVENHKIIQRIAALEHGITAMISDTQRSAMQSDIHRLSADYQEGLAKIQGRALLPSTKISMLDHMFHYFSAQCERSNIHFILNINGSIPFMLEHLVAQSALETMIGDHLQDAIVAVNASDRPFRSISVTLGLQDDCYLFSVFDSGVPFEIDTLIRLGKEYTTTHADSGGEGIGFMTTFETIRNCGASLMISEKVPSATDYSKSVTIRFDGKNEYIIETHRPDCFPQEGDKHFIVVSAHNSSS